MASDDPTDGGSTTPGADPFLHDTDPGFVTYFNSWIRTECDADSSLLDGRTRQIVRIASVIAANGQARFRVLADGALDIGVSPVELKEIVYQAVAYVGYATVSDFLRITNELLRERGVELPLPDQSTTTPQNRLERGREAQERIVGTEQVAGMYAGAPADEQHLQRYLSANVFGDVVARDGLDLPTRELVTFAMLVALGGADEQVKGHVRGNLNVGNDRATLLAVLTALVPAVGYPRVLNGLAALDAITA